MTNYRTPDVYTEEVSTLPQSVAEVSTAVPAFIGHTEKASLDGKDVSGSAVRISNFLEFKEIFGGYKPAAEISIEVAPSDESIQDVTITPPNSTLYYAVDFYFRNGGGACYIVSIGDFSDTYTQNSFINGLNALSKEDEPTLIVLSEATKLESASDYYQVCIAALAQCEKLKDRFCIFDVLQDDTDAQGFRDGIGMNNLKYGAAYTPYLQTSLNYQYKDEEVSISGLEGLGAFTHDGNGIRISYTNSTGSPGFVINEGAAGDPITFSIDGEQLTIQLPEGGATPTDLVTAWDTFEAGNDPGFFDIELSGDPGSNIGTTAQTALTQEQAESVTLAEIKNDRTALYAKIGSELAKRRIILPPGPGVAGIYATTDRQRGVWKAPANISLNAVIAPTVKITSADQEQLNVDANAGKSVNAIRSFTGKGTIVWGARTLAGNDNEWRYISVRRLFNMIEESTKKASYFAVFESNDAATWLKVKAMIESFLYGIWQQGGLAGATEDQAYFVNIGLGKTMTQQDILEGRMVVEIGIAATRPAEFIILRFSHKLQES